MPHSYVRSPAEFPYRPWRAYPLGKEHGGPILVGGLAAATRKLHACNRRQRKRCQQHQAEGHVSTHVHSSEAENIHSHYDNPAAESPQRTRWFSPAMISRR